MNRIVKGWDVMSNVPRIPDIEEFYSNLAGSGRRFFSTENMIGWVGAFESFGIKAKYLEPRYKNFFGNHFEEGAFTHEHIDSAPEGFVHVRCNVMLQKPESGGMPCINGSEISVDVNDLWIVFASKERHSSTPVHCGERLIYSYGALVEEWKAEEVWKALK